jgi:outer membrane receptor for ferrienterochelin and colicins
MNFGGRFEFVDAFTLDGQIRPRINAARTSTEVTTRHDAYARYFGSPLFDLIATTAIAKFAGTIDVPKPSSVHA